MIAIPVARVKTPKPLLGRVQRAHLLARLNAQPHTPCVLIRAQAGSGKTSLLQQWTESLRTAVAWVTLSEEENDPATFIRAMTAALQHAGLAVTNAAVSFLGSQGSVAMEPVVQTLINAIEQLGAPCTLILDDYHLITNEAVHKAVTRLVDHIPEQMRLAITSREEPPLPLARWRLREQILDLGPADLQFTLSEAEAWLNGHHQLGLAPADLDQLLAWADGWAASLQFAALALKSNATVAQLLGFADPGHDLVAFLATEVLSRQPEHLQRFLVETSVLERLCAPLCDAVTGRTESALVLEELYRRNLFLLPLAGEQPTYRFHRLFATFLTDRLKRLHPDWLPALHQRAAAWLEANGSPLEALPHLLTAGDQDGAARILLSIGRPMLDRGEARGLLTWLARLTDAAILADPSLCLIKARAHLQTGETHGGERWLQRAEECLAEQTAAIRQNPSLARVLKGEIAALRCHLPILRHEAGPAIRFARTALACLPVHDSPLRLGVQLDLGLHYYYRLGDLSRAARTFTECARLSRDSANPESALFAYAYLGWVRVSQGRLRQAGPMSGIIHVSMASLLLEWHELAEARRYLQEAMRLAEQGSVMQVLALGYREEVRHLLASGQFDQISGPLHRIRELSGWSMADFWQAVGAFLQGDTARAEAWAADAGFAPESTPRFDNVVRYAFYGDLLAATGKAKLALTVAERLRTFATTHGWSNFALRADLLSAIAYDALGMDTPSVAAIGAALDSAAVEGAVWVFLSRGKAIGRVLSRYATTHRQGITPPTSLAHARRLLAILGEPAVPEAQLNLAESVVLSEREREVLQLIAAGDSNEAIAQRLFVTVGTVKTHLHRIYTKLEVGSRTQAVARARSLGLLE